MENDEVKKIYLPDVIGKGYGKFWRWKGRYRVVKGSRASKKSTTIALNIICRMMQYPLANTLVVKKTASTLKNSCFGKVGYRRLNRTENNISRFRRSIENLSNAH